MNLFYIIQFRWNTLVGTYQGRLLGAQNEMDLMAARGAAEYHDFDNPITYEEVGNRLVCDNHWKELVSDWTNWGLNQHIRKVKENHKLKCGMPSVVSPHSTFPTPIVGNLFLSRDEAKRILNEHHIHVHVGTRKLLEREIFKLGIFQLSASHIKILFL